eukprot:14277065-Alexandrium_andersonii.AAC.1
MVPLRTPSRSKSPALGKHSPTQTTLVARNTVLSGMPAESRGAVRARPDDRSEAARGVHDQFCETETATTDEPSVGFGCSAARSL